MHTRLLSCTLLLAACGSDAAKTQTPGAAIGDAPTAETATVTTSAQPSSTSVASTASAEVPSKRREEAANILRVLKAPDVDAETRGRIAAVGISEAGFGLPPKQLRGLKAIGSESVDPSQCSRILSWTIEETALPLADKRCGGFAAVAKRVAALPPASQAREIATTCKITDVPDGALSKTNAWALLMSALLVDAFSADPQSSEDEKAIARMVSSACPL